MRFQSFAVFVAERFSGDFLPHKRGQWTEIKQPSRYPELASEFFDLISTAYSEVGGHLKVRGPDDVFSDPDWTFWEGVDIHGSPDLDLIVFGQKTKYGVKFSGVGHDGTKESKRAYLDEKAKDLSKLGYYNEVSSKLAGIMVGKYKVPVVEDEAEIEKVIGKRVVFYGEHPTDPDMPGKGWYGRPIAGQEHVKLLIGRPRV